MVVLDNVIYNLQRTGGVSVVWTELLGRLDLQSKLPVKYIEYGNVQSNIFRKTLDLNTNRIIERPNNFLMLKRYLPQRLCGVNERHVFHSSYYRYSTNTLSANITTVHDFTYELYLSGLKRNIHSWQKSEAILHSKFIVCISNNTKKDMLRFVPQVDESKIRVIYNGVSDLFHVLPSLPSSIDLPFTSHSYILFVGSRVGYKNFDFVVDTVKQTNLNLLIVGAPLNSDEKQMLESHLIGRYKLECGVSTERLNALYNYAFVFMYPSSYEGFGIPVLEAQRAGCPVIALNKSSIPEIIGETSSMINDLNVNETLQIFSNLENDKYRFELKEKGLLNSKQYSWDRMYSEYFDLYNEALLN